jgi:hypothetical protein
MKIVVMPLNNFPISLEDNWEESAMPLCDSVTRVCEELRNAGDTNLYVVPTYAQGSRYLAFNGTAGSSSYIANNHNLERIGIDSNVHMLYVEDDSNADYRESLLACVANLIS